MIPEFGLCSLIIAFGLALLTAVLLPLAVFKPQWAYCQGIAKPLALGQCFFVLLSFLILMFCFTTDNFSVLYVAQNSYSGLPLIYKICAVWGAHEGSLLLWALILSVWTVSVTCLTRANEQHVRLNSEGFETASRERALITGILSALQTGFLFLLLQTSNPFNRLLPFPAKEGIDLNPLLQDPGFVLHPPLLYLGYVGFAVPFAFVIAAMLLKDQSFQWARRARPWALLAWSFLTLGIILGSWWAYYELGWGGWWFWDPVENASFMPWLMGAALVHALLIASDQKIFSAWSILLALSAFILSLMGTFLVRSGVLSSVHAFASDPLRGIYILSFLGIVSLGSLGLYLYRQPQSATRLPISFFSKQALLLLGNMILFVATLTVLLGTLYPLLIEVLSQEKISVGPPYFNSVFIPILVPALLLMAITPHLNWHSERWQQLRPKVQKIGLIFVGLTVMWLIFFQRFFSLIATCGILLGIWVAVGTVFKLISYKPFWRMPVQKWGMVLAHLGLSCVVLGITLTSSLESEKEFKIAVGQTVSMGQYQLLFHDLKEIAGTNFHGVEGNFVLKNQEKEIAQLYPQKRYFVPRNLPMTETAINAGFLRDFYLALGESLADGSWSVRFYIKPFVRWIWLGGLMIAVGAFLSALALFNREFNQVENKS